MIKSDLSNSELTDLVSDLLKRVGPDYSTCLTACIDELVPLLQLKDFCVDIISAKYAYGGWRWEVHIHPRGSHSTVSPGYTVAYGTSQELACAICEVFVNYWVAR